MSSDNPTGAGNQQERLDPEDPESSETVRRALQANAMPERDETVRSLWRHREDDRNDRPATQMQL